MRCEPYDLTIISFDDCLFQFSGGEREQGPRPQHLVEGWQCPWRVEDTMALPMPMESFPGHEVFRSVDSKFGDFTKATFL
jgi:hypothetical protein